MNFQIRLQSSLVPTYFESNGVPKSVTPVCKEIHRRLYPIKGKGSDGKLYYIVNVKEFQQRTDVVTCKKSGVPCGDKSLTPENRTYRCIQKYEDAKLSTFPVGGNITMKSQTVNVFKIPSGCVCELIRMSN